MIRFTLTIVTLITLFSCGKTDKLSDDEEKAIVESIRQTMSNYYSDIRTSGLTAEFKYLDNSPEFFWVPPGYTSAISYDSVAVILKQSAPLYKSIDNSFDTLRIIPLDKALAAYTARLTSTMTDTTGKVSKFSLMETGLLIKRQDGWKLLSGQTSIISK